MNLRYSLSYIACNIIVVVAASTRYSAVGDVLLLCLCFYFIYFLFPFCWFTPKLRWHTHTHTQGKWTLFLSIWSYLIGIVYLISSMILFLSAKLSTLYMCLMCVQHILCTRLCSHGNWMYPRCMCLFLSFSHFCSFFFLKDKY